MAYDYEDDSPRPQTPAREPVDYFSYSYKMALAIWIVPAIVVGMMMAAINLRTYDTVLVINPEDGDDFLKSEQRIARGWPYVLASVERSSSRWALNGFGFCIDGIIALAAMIITAGTSRYVAAFVDYDVNKPIQKQVHKLFRGRPKKAAPKRSAPSGRMPMTGAPKVRRPKPPLDNE